MVFLVITRENLAVWLEEEKCRTGFSATNLASSERTAMLLSGVSYLMNILLSCAAVAYVDAVYFD